VKADSEEHFFFFWFLNSVEKAAILVVGSISAVVC
jgi:hypothetical protein